MKAKRYAVSVQYGGGFHFFRHYTDDAKEAFIKRDEVHRLTVGEYESRKGRRGVRPTVMVWERVTPPTPMPVVGEPDYGGVDIEILNGSEFMGNANSRVQEKANPPFQADHGDVTLEVIEGGALAGVS